MKHINNLLQVFFSKHILAWSFNSHIQHEEPLDFWGTFFCDEASARKGQGPAARIVGQHARDEDEAGSPVDRGNQNANPPEERPGKNGP